MSQVDYLLQGFWLDLFVKVIMPHLFGITKEKNIWIQHFVLGYYLPQLIKIETANHNNMTKILS